MRVGIIGGGVTGLTAAHEFTKLGHQVEVFEKSPELGGQASTFNLGGAPLERLYHHLFTSDHYAIEMLEELGLGSKLEWIDSRVGLYHGGRIWPWVTPMDLLRFSNISVLDRMRLGLVTLYLQKKTDGLVYEDVTAAEWLSHKVGRRGFEAVWEPLLRGKFGDYHSEVSMTWLWGKIRLRVGSRGKGMAREKLAYPLGSFGILSDELAKRIAGGGGQIHTSASVIGVELDGGRACGLRVVMDGKENIVPFDAILATIPSFAFERIVTSIPSDYAELLRSTNYLSALVLVLVLDRQMLPVYWLNIADRGIPFVAVIEHTNFIPPSQYGGRHIVYVSNYLKPDSPLYGRGKEELLAEYAPHLKRLNSAFDPGWVKESYLFREDGAQPVITRGYSRKIPTHRTPVECLYLANTAQIYPEDRGVNYSIRLGRDIAKLIASEMSR